MTTDSPQNISIAEQEHAELSRQLHHHNHLYHGLDQPEISDAEYDQLMQRLLQLENTFPQLATAGSPSQRVGSTPSTALPR